METIKMKEAKNMSELEDIRQENRTAGNRQTRPNEDKLTDEEWMDYKVENWDNVMNCSSVDKKAIMKWLVNTVKEMSITKVPL